MLRHYIACSCGPSISPVDAELAVDAVVCAGAAVVACFGDSGGEQAETAHAAKKRLASGNVNRLVTFIFFSITDRAGKSLSECVLENLPVLHYEYDVVAVEFVQGLKRVAVDKNDIGIAAFGNRADRSVFVRIHAAGPG